MAQVPARHLGLLFGSLPMARKRRRLAVPAGEPTMPRSITIRESSNGFIIESWQKDRQHTVVAESAAGALKAVKAFLGK